MRRQLLAAFAVLSALLQLSCAGATDHGDLINLVQRVALVPGADALDAIDPTPVGKDWNRIDFYLTEPLSADSRAAFDPAVHLYLGGLTLSSFAFTGGGAIPAGGILRVNLQVPSGGLEEGRYTIRLLSPPDHRLVGQSGHVYDGETAQFQFRVQVVPKNDRLPCIVTFKAGDFFTADQIDHGTWEGDEVIAIPDAERVPPHGGVRVEFSERMRTPVPVQGSPIINLPATLELRIPGSTNTISRATTLPLIPGLQFQQSQEILSWSDTVELSVTNREVTVLTSDTPEGLEIDQRYHVVFDGTPPLTSNQSPVYDVSGEPLGIRFLGGFAAPEDTIYRNHRSKDTRAFTTAPVRLSSPGHGSYLNSGAFSGGAAPLSADGLLADRVAEVRLAIAPDAAEQPPAGVAATRTVVAVQTQLGVPIDIFAGSVALSAASADGPYRVFAEAVGTGGESLGWDFVRVVKDTVAPAMFGGSGLEIQANEQQVGDLCVLASADTVLAEVHADAGSPPIDTVLKTSTSFTTSLFFRRQFCFEPFDLPETFHGGLNQIRIRLVDTAGNESTTVRTLRIRPILLSVGPDDTRAGDTLILVGQGLQTLRQTTSVSLVAGFLSPIICARTILTRSRS